MGFEEKLNNQKTFLKFIEIISNICFLAMLVLAVSPIVGLFIPTHNSLEIGHLFEAKTMIVKIVGILCCFMGLFSFVIKIFLYGGKYALETFIKNPWNILFVLMLIWMAISIKQVNPLLIRLSIFGWAYVYEGFISYIAYAGIYLGASSLRNEKQKSILVKTMLITSFIVAFFTLTYEKGIVPNAFFRNGMTLPYSGSFINPNHYAYYLCVMCIVSAVAVFCTKNKYWRLFYFASFFLNTAVLCLNGTFGSYLAVLIGMIFFSFWFIKKKETRKYAIYIDFIFVVLTLVLNLNYILVDLKGFFQGIFELIQGLISGRDASSAVSDITSDTADGRAADWSTALQAIKDSPLFGYGPDMEHDTFVFKYGHKSSSHNIFFYTAVCSGIPALAAFVSALTCLIVKSFRNLKKATSLEKAFMLGFGVFMISGFFGISLPIANFIFFMMLGLVNSYMAKDKEVKCVLG